MYAGHFWEYSVPAVSLNNDAISIEKSTYIFQDTYELRSNAASYCYLAALSIQQKSGWAMNWNKILRKLSEVKLEGESQNLRLGWYIKLGLVQKVYEWPGCYFDKMIISWGGSFWPKDSLITFIIFELCLIWYISPVANFGTHPLQDSRLRRFFDRTWKIIQEKEPH